MVLRGVPIGARLGIGFAIILALLAFVVVGGNVMSDASMRKLASGQETANAKGSLAAAMKGALLEAAVATRNIGLQAEVRDMSREEDRVKAQRTLYAQARERLEKTGLTAEEKAVLDNVARLEREIEEPFVEAIGHSLNFSNEIAAKVIATRIDPLTQQSIVEINKLVDMQEAAAQALLTETAASAQRLRVLFYVVGALAIAAGLALAWVITRSITGPLQDAVAIAGRVATGDLSAEVSVTGKDEIASLLGALRTMNGNLRGIVREVRDTSEAVARSSDEIARGNGDLSSRTEEQASSLEETASSMEELTTTVRQNVEHARQANQLSSGASTIADEGGRMMGEMVSEMGVISDASRRIADIIGVIDGIAFQTNILALNAAVEAARAGEQGRGFAVVASEVRALAQRSASAAKEIKELIQNSVDKVNGGTRLVEAAGGKMTEIVAAVKRVRDVITEIASASEEQLQGIEQVSRAVMQMDQVVQQNAALVEESAAAAENMAVQAGQLVQIVERFKIAGAAEARPAAQSAASGARVVPLPVRGKQPALRAAGAGMLSREERG